MKSIVRTVLATVIAGVVLGQTGSDQAFGNESRVTFETAKVGELPPEFSTALTGGGRPGKWIVLLDEGQKVLAQQDADDTNVRYPLCIYESFFGENVEVSVRFKPVSGRVDRAAGIIVRYVDNNHYIVVRPNATENNLRAYEVIKGVRQNPFASVNVTVETNMWQTIQVRMHGSHLQVYMNGDAKPLIDVKRAFTNSGPGKVGLWTKADSVTLFDDLVVHSSQ